MAIVEIYCENRLGEPVFRAIITVHALWQTIYTGSSARRARRAALGIAQRAVCRSGVPAGRTNYGKTEFY